MQSPKRYRSVVVAVATLATLGLSRPADAQAEENWGAVVYVIIGYTVNSLLIVGGVVATIANMAAVSSNERPSDGWLGAGYALGGLNIIAGSVALSFEHYVIGGVGLGVGLLSAGMGIAAHSQPEVGAKSSPLVGVDLPRWIVAPTIFPSQSGAHGVGLGLRLALP